MTTVLLVIHMIIAVAMIITVLLQRSEGGALGIGGGGMMSGRALGNVLTRTTSILAAIFFVTSIALTIIGTVDRNGSVLDGVIENDGEAAPFAPAPLLPEPDLPTPPSQ